MTGALAPRMRWWGWGVDGHDAPLPRAAIALLRGELAIAALKAVKAQVDPAGIMNPGKLLP